LKSPIATCQRKGCTACVEALTVLNISWIIIFQISMSPAISHRSMYFHQFYVWGAYVSCSVSCFHLPWNLHLTKKNLDNVLVTLVHDYLVLWKVYSNQPSKDHLEDPQLNQAQILAMILI
jgi:hypothetical protein